MDFGGGMSPGSFMMGSGLGQLGAGLYNTFFPGKDPYSKALKTFGKIPGEISPNYQPYIQAGQNALGQLQGQFGNLANMQPDLMNQFSQLTNDPNAILNRLGSGYQQSPGFKFQMEQGQNAINNAAAAGGMAGTPQHQQQAGTLANNLANQDFMQYLQNALGLFGTGLQGKSSLYGAGLSGLQNLTGLGAESGNQFSRALIDNLSNQGALQYAQQANRNQNKSQGIGDIIGGAGSLIGMLGLL